MSIAIQNLSKTYSTQQALDGISFTTKSNHIIGFLGPNGAGKSTTMKILAGILPFQSGECRINNINIRSDALEAKKNLGYLPENNPLYLDMYVREILAFEAKIHHLKNPDERIKEVIQRTGLAAEQQKKVHQLSKGYRQRVGLALAIIHDPQVLILDEPTSGLDPIQILEIRSLIKALSKDKTVLLSTHIMQDVEALCEEIVILDKGNIQDYFVISEKELQYL